MGLDVWVLLLEMVVYYSDLSVLHVHAISTWKEKGGTKAKMIGCIREEPHDRCPCDNYTHCANTTGTSDL